MTGPDDDNQHDPDTKGTDEQAAGSDVDPDADTEAAPAHGDMDPLMLELLVCPLTKKSLTFDAQTNELVSEAAGLAFPVRGGIPILLPSEARSLRDDPQ